MIELAKQPRGETLVRTNECRNPSFDSAGDVTAPALPYGWKWLGFGVGGAGTQYVGGPGTYATVGSRAMVQVWSTAPTGNYHEVIGFEYDHTAWVAGQAKHVSAYLFSNAALGVELVANYMNGSTYISADRSAATALTPNGKTRLDAVVGPAPAGTTHVVLDWTLVSAGARPAVGTVLAIDAVLIEAGAGPLYDYFDGDTWPTGQGIYRTGWDGTHGASQSRIYQLANDTLLHPEQLADRHQYQLLSRNTVHQLLDGGVAAVLADGTLRSGVLKLLFDDTAAAVNAAEQHRTAGSWSFDDDENPDLAMLYVVNPAAGAIQVYQDDTRSYWVVEVPFHEVPS